MSKYTAEQVEKEAEYQSHKFLTYTTVGMLRDYAALLRERESAKAAVTNEMVEIAVNAHADWFGGHRGMRAALEAVAPMLASTRVPGGWQLVPVEATDEMCEAAWESDASDYVGEHHRIHRADLAYKAMLAAAPKPKTEE